MYEWQVRDEHRRCLCMEAVQCIADIRVVDEQILAFPTKLDVRVFALIIRKRPP